MLRQMAKARFTQASHCLQLQLCLLQSRYNSVHLIPTTTQHLLKHSGPCCPVWVHLNIICLCCCPHMHFMLRMRLESISTEYIGTLYSITVIMHYVFLHSRAQCWEHIVWVCEHGGRRWADGEQKACVCVYFACVFTLALHLYGEFAG